MNRLMLYSLLSFSLLSTAIGKADFVSEFSEKFVQTFPTELAQRMVIGAVIGATSNLLESNFIKANLFGATAQTLINNIIYPTTSLSLIEYNKALREICANDSKSQLNPKAGSKAISATLLGYIVGAAAVRKVRSIICTGLKNLRKNKQQVEAIVINQITLTKADVIYS